MKIKENILLIELKEEDLTNINGGSEFSEAVFKTLGFVAKACYIFALEGGRNAHISVR
ncbi:hypothetical protein [Pedobacter paludis]|uniref:hypothetical protein n=1 Tax=Pedobacter paludis TaxID=2203212 RepID=UPI0013144594|nr:hypothetical protein [Pedobacter paludis]